MIHSLIPNLPIANLAERSLPGSYCRARTSKMSPSRSISAMGLLLLLGCVSLHRAHGFAYLWVNEQPYSCTSHPSGRKPIKQQSPPSLSALACLHLSCLLAMQITSPASPQWSIDHVALHRPRTRRTLESSSSADRLLSPPSHFAPQPRATTTCTSLTRASPSASSIPPPPCL